MPGPKSSPVSVRWIPEQGVDGFPALGATMATSSLKLAPGDKILAPEDRPQTCALHRMGSVPIRRETTVMKRLLRARVMLPLLTVAGLAGGCATLEQTSIDVAAALVPDPDLAIDRPDFASEVAIKRIAYKLDLAPEQLEKLRAIKTEIIEIRREERAEQDQLINAWIAEIRRPRMEEARLQAMLAEREKFVDRYAPRVLEKVIAFHASLSDEQKEMIASRAETLRDWQPGN